MKEEDIATYRNVLVECLRAAERGEPQEVDTDIMVHVKTVTEWRNDSPRTILLTSLVKKSANPDQDIRMHQKKMPGGYSGRTLDTECVTPFLTSNQFPHMAVTGWSSKIFEHTGPYTLDYAGAIAGKGIREAFLTVLDRVENGQADPRLLITYMFKLLIRRRDTENMRLPRPTNLTISKIISYLEKHFECGGPGKSRLPVLAVYAIYQQMVGGGWQRGRWRSIPLQKHPPLGLEVAYFCRFPIRRRGRH